MSPPNHRDLAMNQLKGYKMREDHQIMKQSISSFYNKDSNP